MSVDSSQFIKSFFLAKEVDDFVVNLLFQEFKKPGLILLPSGNTFEETIYPRVDSMFAIDELNTFNSSSQEINKKEIRHKVNPGLTISHIDELIPESEIDIKNKFAKAIKSKLPNLINQISGKFIAINVNDIEAFDKFLRQGGGPRLIFAGLGKNPEHAHFAFIGEDFINSQTCEIELSTEMKKEHKVSKAITIGTDILASTNLEKIYVVVKGEAKAAALKAALEDDTTGLGYVIANHASKLCILADKEALSLIK